MLARAKNPLFFFAASVNFLPMLSINNTITFDASQFWNSSSAILTGIAVGAVAMLIVPPLSPAIRTSRLLALTLADLRRLAKRAPSRRREDDWESRGVARFAGDARASRAGRTRRARRGDRRRRTRSCGCAVSRLGSSRARPWTRRFKRWPKDEAARRSSASRTSTANSLPCPAPGPAAASVLRPPGRPPRGLRSTRREYPAYYDQRIR